MSIVESDQSLACLVMQSQAVVQSVRPLLAHLQALHDEPDTISTFSVGKECHAIERKKRVKRWILSVPPIYILSDTDNKWNAALTRRRALFKRKP